MMFRSGLVCLCVGALALACSDDTQSPYDAASDGPAEDLQQIDGPAVDSTPVDSTPVDSTPVDSTPVDSTPVDSTPVDSTPVDSTPVDSTPEDSTPVDTSRDGSAPDPGPVQCRVSADCNAGQSCYRVAPGGICRGCGTCLDPIDFECRFSACVRYCTDDNGCNAGMRCSGTGYCVLRNCSTPNPCPAPYVCNDDGRCSRPSCSTTNPSCPAPLICDGSLCLEP